MLNMKFPASQGVFTRMTSIPEKLNYLFIVKATVEKGHKLFRYNKHNLYTSYDLQNAKRLKLSFELIDDEINCLSYEHSRVIDGKTFFKPFINYWYEMKSNGVPFSKLMLNSLWGVLCKTNKLRYPVQQGEELHAPNGYKLTKMTKGMKQDGTYEYEFKHLLTSFKYSYARLKPFLLAKAKASILTDSIT